MSIGRILSSNTKVQILRVLSSRSSALSPGELEKETTKNISVIYNAVRELNEEKIISGISAEGKTNYYLLNKENRIADQIKQLFDSERKEYGLEDLPAHLVNIIFEAENQLRNKIEGLRLILLFGSLARGDFTPESDIDLYLVIDEKSIDKEDQIYDVLDNYDKDFSVIIREEEKFKQEFGDEISELANSILVEGFAIIYSADKHLENIVNKRMGWEEIARENNMFERELDVEKLKDFIAEYEVRKDEKEE